MRISDWSSDVCSSDLPLPPVAARVDAELARIDGEVDWLLALSPIGNEALWDSFEASGHAAIPPLQYIDLELDLHAARERVMALPVEDIESHLLSGLLSEKQRELERQLELEIGSAHVRTP